MKYLLYTLAGWLLMLVSCGVKPQAMQNARLIDVDSGWANNSVNTVIFRKNALVTHGDTQFIAFYNKDGYVVAGKRKSGSRQWKLQRTPFTGNVADAHNVISLMTDGKGYLHLAWDHHNNPLHYTQSIAPGSLQFAAPAPMTNRHEDKVSYPEFYLLSSGNLLFLYRDGGSGRGNLVVNEYDAVAGKWSQLHSNLIDGEGARNAYWQACTDGQGTIHLSWVWRESPDVASNHDMCYARSLDGGKTWETSQGKKYDLPITAATAEYVCRIPQNSELINQTSMVADEQGHPFIATYWRDAGDSVPQYHVLYHDGNEWTVSNLHFRSAPFSLSGMGTKRIPISRPQIVTWNTNHKQGAALIFRDEERGNKVSVAVAADMNRAVWRVTDLTLFAVQSWEPNYDTELWKQAQTLHLFIQKTEQVDGEGKASLPPQMVQVLEWKPGYNKQ